jgi:hypothetical protein
LRQENVPFELLFFDILIVCIRHDPYVKQPMLTGGTTNAGIVRPSQNSGTQILVVPTNPDIAIHLTSLLALQRLFEGSVSPLQGKLINKEASVLRLSQTFYFAAVVHRCGPLIMS